jgi:Rps23 Pro-64 3,4-dihydroxylase Tpa1-like proline 4-hydroxylase
MSVKIIDNFFSPEELQTIFDLFIPKLVDPNTKWEVNNHWPDYLRNGFNNILTLNMKENGYEHIFDIISKKYQKHFGVCLDKENDLHHVSFTVMPEGSGINWHNDGGKDIAATIYLNDKWDFKNGGLMLYKNDQETFTGLVPKLNQCVVLTSSVYHCVTKVTCKEYARVSFQIFFDKDIDS